ncbi:MAG: hypothetical protein Q9163_004713 [Psora crenata]
MKLVDARAVRDLLSDNVDENVSHYVYDFSPLSNLSLLSSLRAPTPTSSREPNDLRGERNSVFTDHGTLLSHDYDIHKSALTRFAPFAGTVWRNHTASITSTGNTDCSVGGLPAMKTLKVDVKADGTGLRSLIVELDGVVSVLRLIIPRLLVAAQLESAKFAGETDELSARIAGLAGGDREGGDGHGRSADGVETNGDGGTGGGDAAADAGDKDVAKNDNAPKKLSKMRILELKAEGMAESLADEHPAKLPNDFY